MTETTFTSPRLERPRDTPLAGVATALARTTGTDVVLWRVLFVVLTVFGGLGIALYLACVVSIPSEGAEHSLVTRLLHGDRRLTTRQVLLLALVLVATVGALHDNGGAVVVAGAAALWYFWWHRRHPSPLPPPATGVGVGPASASEGPLPDSRPAATYEAPAWVPPAPRLRSVVTPLTLSAAAVVVGVLLLVAAAGAASVPTEVVLAAALGVVGLGLVASAFWGRARGLVPVALLLALALSSTFGARPAVDHGIGERHWDAVRPSAYRLGIGDATLRLAGPLVHAAGPKDIDARVTLGHLKVVVPEGAHVVVDAHVAHGAIQADGYDDSGRNVDKTFDLGPRDEPPVYVHARVSVGMVEVRRG
jgi:phage shock protein PspC (stress-responsive transcriptional regulator)